MATTRNERAERDVCVLVRILFLVCLNKIDDMNDMACDYNIMSLYGNPAIECPINEVYGNNPATKTPDCSSINPPSLLQMLLKSDNG